MTPIRHTAENHRAFFKRRYRLSVRPVQGLWLGVPLLTVVFLVTLLLLLNDYFVLRPGITVNLPTAPFVSGAPPSPLVVTLTREGSVFFNDEWVPFDKLPDAFGQAVLDHPNDPLIIEADRRTPYYLIIRLYNAAMAVGIKDVLLATRPMGEVKP